MTGGRRGIRIVGGEIKKIFPDEYIKKHFEFARIEILAQWFSAGKLSSTSTGNSREDTIRSFLEKHLPGGLRVGTGHILLKNGKLSRQMDVVIYRPECLALPLGSQNIFLSKGILCCIEVKTQLDYSTCPQVSDVFSSIEDVYDEVDDAPILKVVVAGTVNGCTQRRRQVAEMFGPMPKSGMPDMVVLLDTSAVLQDNSVRVLGGTGHGTGVFFKYGEHGDESRNDRWLPLALLVFEVAQRGYPGSIDWTDLLGSVLPDSSSLIALK